MAEIERMIRTIKEWLWAIIAEMVYNVTFRLNAFPHNDCVHELMNLHTILTGLHINHENTVH